MKTVPFLDLGRLHQSIRTELDAAFDEIVRSSAYVGSQAISSFEEAFAAAHDRLHAVGCNSGTDAISLALRALGIGPGDEVVVPSMTFFATAEAVLHAGAQPVLADVDPVTLLLDEARVEAVRTSATKAVLPVHLYGHVVPFDTLRTWRDSGLCVIEDAAQAHLATDGNAAVGTVSSAAAFSFFPGKNLGALGDAGAIVTDDDEVAATMRRLRDHGRVDKYRHDEVGVSSRLDGLQAAFLAVKLRHLPEWTQSRRQLAEHYTAALAEVDGASVVPYGAGAVHHLYVVQVDAEKRAEIRSALSDAGVQTGVHYPIPLSGQPALAHLSTSTPNAEVAARQVLSLPIDPLMTIDEVTVVVSSAPRRPRVMMASTAVTE